MVPCKVGVWQDRLDAVVAAVRPEVTAMVAGSETLMAIAREAEEHIERALVRLEASSLDSPSATH